MTQVDAMIPMNIHVLPQTRQLRAMLTIVRDRNAERGDFVLYSQRIIRLLLESAMDLLPFEARDVETPVGSVYEGLRAAGPVFGVSILRAGDSMESVLREMSPSTRIGKILIQRDKSTKLPSLYYSNLPNDIADGSVLLLDPMLATGGTALAAIRVLIEKGVAVENVVFVSFIAAPEGIAAVREQYPQLKIVTSAIERGLNSNAYMEPGIGDFGDRFFGTQVSL